jgi:alkyl hydroperoxide reductase subunit AhpC
MERWKAANTQVLGISIDSVYSHRAFAKELKPDFPLLADFHPKGEVARRYGVYLEDRGHIQRSIFIIDGGGVLRWSETYTRELPNMSVLHDVLVKLAS